MKRFPKDFMFQLTEKEKDEVVANCDHLESLKYSTVLPFAFTEYGAVMLASVLNSDRAIKVNIQIVRIYSLMREMLLTNQEILLKLERLERQTVQNTAEVQAVIEYLKQMLVPVEQVNRRKIGYRSIIEED